MKEKLIQVLFADEDVGLYTTINVFDDLSETDIQDMYDTTIGADGYQDDFDIAMEKAGYDRVFATEVNVCHG